MDAEYDVYDTSPWHERCLRGFARRTVGLTLLLGLVALMLLITWRALIRSVGRV